MNKINQIIIIVGSVWNKAGTWEEKKKLNSKIKKFIKIHFRIEKFSYFIVDVEFYLMIWIWCYYVFS